MGRQYPTLARPGLTRGRLLAVLMLAFVAGYAAGSASSLSILRSAPLLAQRCSLPRGRMLGSGSGQPCRTAAAEGSGGHCAKVFTGYVPSSWEQSWASSASQLQQHPDDVCSRLVAELPNTRGWLSGVQQLRLLRHEADRRVFSEFRYRDNCTGAEHSVYIEPLVGHFRHPFVPNACLPNMSGLIEARRGRGYIMNRTHIALVGAELHQFKTVLYPGKRYLFDVGHNFYMSQTGWLLERYAEMGITFDEIWAWEPRPMADYWDTVPRDVQPRLHFYNSRVALNETDPSNPLNIIRRIVQPGDYVVFKLDIDDARVEMVMFNQIMAATDLQPLISELLFEMHYNDPHMQKWFGLGNGQRWIDVLNTFSAVRRSGIRLHYWP